MADSLVTVAAEAILKKVASIAANEIALAWGYKEKLYTLERTLKMIRAKLQDAENQKGQKHSVMEWLKQLKDVVGEADDVVDEVHYEMLRREVKNRHRVGTKVPSLPSLKKLFFRSEMGHKIKNINEKLSQINKQANELGLQNEQPGHVVQYRPYPETVPNLGEFRIFGREDDEERIIHLLTESRKEEKLTIVPIVGMGGMGKTTLAKSVYNNPKIQQHFDVKAWLCVSVKVNINTLLAKIYESVAGEKPKSETTANLVRDLEKKLEAKRYLLVLDDVWDEERLYWEDFRSVMINVTSQIGSGILVTTRKLDIGTKAMMMDSCPLKGLSDDDCWNIFKERAFLARQSAQPELEKIGRDIVKKCRGLPLLLNAVGEQNEDDEFKAKVFVFIERNTVARTLHTLFIKGEVEKKLSFQRLKCIRILKLNGYKLEKLDDSFGELVHLRYLDLSSTKIRVLPKSIGKLYHLQTLKLPYGFEQFPEAMRNLISLRYFKCDQDIPANIVGQLISLRKLPSFTVLRRKGHGIEELRHLNNLSGSLFISHLENVSSKEIAVKADLSRKKNLYDIHFKWSEEDQSSNRVDKDVLEGLQPPRDVKILTIENFSSDNFPDWVMKMAIHIERKWTPVDKLMKITLFGCRNCLSLPTLERLPHLWNLELVGMDSLTCLRSSDVTGSTKPLSPSLSSLWLSGMKRLEKWIEGATNSSNMISPVLQSLEIFRCPKIILIDECHPHPLVSLRIWNCTGLEYIRSIQGLTSLEYLHIDNCPSLLGIGNFSGDNYPESVTKMAIDIEGKWTPLDKLLSIRLDGCRSCLSLSALEHLPHLRDLVLKNMHSLTCLMNSNITGSMKPFSPSLRSLTLDGMNRLEKWIDGATNSSKMISPVLEKLVIENCPKIILIDECHPHPLVSLTICNCTGLEYIKSIQGLTSLEYLRIDNCPSLSVIANLPKQCHSLKTLIIKHCHKLTSLPLKMFDCFAFLNELTLGPFSKGLDSFPSLQGIEKLRDHLHYLELRGWDHWESMPEEIQHLTSLTWLQIIDFRIQELPMWLTNMSSIRNLWFYECKGLNKETVRRGAPWEATDVRLNTKEC
ncbi:unnamed protein product [Lactuca saligna]|uniref:Uncharacterized protein n=1 Tax=Lactuca saligna TaxID=75948 RepID=A0AA35VL36_LACSI|nr:unnamed protein product [Lactuca saligna]